MKCVYICVLSISERAQVEKLTANTVEFDAEEHISLGIYLPGRRAILQCLTLEGNLLVRTINVNLILIVPVIVNLCMTAEGKSMENLKISHGMKNIM